MRITRIWAMPNKWTFTIKPIKELIERYVGDGEGWIDPFAGFNSPAEFTNDMNTKTPTRSHIEALPYLLSYEDEQMEGSIYDPPYSPAQMKWCYNFGTNLVKRNTEFNKYLSKCRKELVRVTRVCGCLICCGWNSGGIGKKYGLELIEILLVPHGANRNDTIVTVERKIQSKLE